MSWVRRREIPIAIFAICFFVSVIGYYFSNPIAKALNSELSSWIMIMTNIALGTGFIALFLHHSKKISRKAKGFPFSFVIFGAIAVMFIAQYSGPAIRGWLYSDIFSNVTTAVICFALFYEVSGAYRAFRIRNLDALLLMLAGFILIIHFAPFYESAVPSFAVIPNWILDVPGMGASRGIVIGVAIGTIAIAVRILLGYEKAYTG